MHEPPAIDNAPAPPQAQAVPGNGMAITAFVFGLVGLVVSFCGLGPLFGIVAVILGPIAWAGGAANPPRRGGLGLAISGTIMGTVALLFGCVMSVGIMLPALGKARATARMLKSSSQMRQVAVALSMYADNNGGGLPPADSWESILVDEGYLLPETLVSPASDGLGPEYILIAAPTLTDAPGDVLFFEDPAHHHDWVVVTFHDLTVESLSHEEFGALVQELGISLP